LRRAAVQLAASAMLVLCTPFAAFANDEIELGEDSHLQQVIPPAMVQEGSFEVVSEPLNLDDIVVTDRTPADHFVSATTPLVVALMLGSVGLVIYTLTRVDKHD
jgi:hypothetical protein